MEKFTASNGLVLVPHRDGSVRWEAGFSPTVVTAALREFFLHERDQELGRWRWPENPDYVVSLSEGGEAVWVLNERDAGMLSFTREMNPPSYEYDEAGYARAAWAYFAAHPEPKPWHDAKPGEVWAISHASGGETVWVVDEDFTTGKCLFRPVVKTDPNLVGITVTGTRIKSARRVWPEVSDG